MKVTLIQRYKGSLPLGLKNSLQKKWCPTLARHLRKKKILTANKELFIVLVDKSEGIALNRQYRGKNKPTDVLSFAPIEKGSLGELILCIPVLKKQAKAHGLTLEEETGYMVIHGVLHLLGYEHEKGDKAARRMYRLQEELFVRILHSIRKK